MMSKPSPSQLEPVKKAPGDRIVGCFNQLHREVRRTVNQIVDLIPVAWWGLDALGGGQPRVRLTSTLNANQIRTAAYAGRDTADVAAHEHGTPVSQNDSPPSSAPRREVVSVAYGCGGCPASSSVRG